MHGSRSKIPSKNSRIYIDDVEFLVLLAAPDIYDIGKLRVKLDPMWKSLVLTKFKLIFWLLGWLN
jgi:hypothetical protein